MYRTFKLRLKKPVRLLWVLIYACIVSIAVNIVLTLGASAAPTSMHRLTASSFLPAALQSVITVTNNNDMGVGSLRQAILAANDGDTIVFAPEVSGTIGLATGDLQLTKSLTIQGPGPTVLAVSGLNATRVFYIFGANGWILVNISGLTIRDGDTSACGGGICASNASLVLSDTMVVSNAGGLGGGITSYNEAYVINSSILSNISMDNGGGIYHIGSLVVVNSVISGNTTSAAGGGITSGWMGATLVIQNSTLANNRSGRHAGGIGLATGATAVITNTTISGNVSESDGGGGLDIYGTASIVNSTLVNNSAISGGGIRNLSGSVMLKNSIVANNVSGGNCVGAMQSNGHNLSNSATCKFTSTGDLQNVAPQIGPLANNGGQTLTHLLLPGSPAINAGDNSGCPATDQRGILRPQAGMCDIGAVELAFPNTLYVPTVLR